MQVATSKNLSCNEYYPVVFWLGFFSPLSVDMLPQLLAYHVPTFNAEERRGTRVKIENMIAIIYATF